jgi:1-acyl-sn-glycerol-3-phosphate acyltransferase
MLSVETGDILAICVVTTVALAAAGWIMSMLRRSPFTPVQSILYGLNYILTRILWRMQIQGELSLPADQGAVIICNHRCPLDPSFIQATTPRAIHWMVAKEYCEFPGFRELLAACEVIPVRRGAVDRAAIRQAIDLLQRGELVGMFPEGYINVTEELLLPGHPGAALIALKGNVPVVPCYIEGAPYDGTTLGCLFMSAHVKLTIGQPINLTDVERGTGREVLNQWTRRFLIAIASLAGRTDYHPRLIGHL